MQTTKTFSTSRFKVWHYSGALLHETMWPEGQELLEVIWQTYPSGKFTEKPITNVKLEGIKSTQPQASPQAYKPPNARGINITPTRTAANNDNRIPGAAPTKAGRKDRRTQRSANYSKTRNEKSDENNDATNIETAQSNDSQSPRIRPNNNAKKSNKPNSPSDDPEKTKRMKALSKKLNDISKLKVRREKGEQLELNQIKKIDSEASLIKELNDLKIT